MNHGTEEDDTCNRGGCKGKLELQQESCFCSATSCPPCSACENCELVCDTCDWYEGDEDFIANMTPLEKLKEYRYENTHKD